MSASAEVKEEIVSQYLRTSDGIVKLGNSMAKPVLTGVSYKTPWVWSHREVVEPFPEGGREVRATYRDRIVWAEVLNGRGRLHLMFERMREAAVLQLADGLSESWFAHAHAQPIAGGLGALTDVGGRSLVLNALTYRQFMQRPELLAGLDVFGPRWEKTFGEAADWNGSPLICYRKLEPGFVWLVPRDSLERSPIEVSVRVVENTRLPTRTLSGHIEYEFEARLTVSPETLAMDRRSV